MAQVVVNRADSLETFRQKLNEVSQGVGDKDNLDTTADNLSEAINEHEADIGDMVLNTSADNLTAAINEHEVDIGDMSLNTTASNLTAAINEHETDIGDMVLDTGANDLTGAINEHEADIGDMVLETTGSTLTEAINEHETDIGDMDLAVFQANNISGALRELQDEKLDKTIVSPDGLLDGLNTSSKVTLVGAINEHESDIGSMILTTTATDLTAAINEHESDIGDMSLSGYVADNLSAAMREIAQQRGTMLLTTTATDITGAINELDSKKINLTSGSTQVVDSSLTYTAGNTQTVEGTLRVTGTLEVAGGAGALNITNTYLELGDSTIDTPVNGGIRVLRGDGGGASQIGDVEVKWDESLVGTESSKAWKVVGMDDSDLIRETSLVTFYNAKELIANNEESGINVTWDSANENFDFNVDDFTITLSGDLSGSATINNLGDVTLNATVVADAVELGVNTTGNYVESIAGVANQITVLGGHIGEGSNITLQLAPNPIVSGITAGNVTAGLTTDNTITTTAGQLTIDSFAGQTNINDNLVVTGNTVLNGNLTVTGTMTTVNTEEINLADNIINLNSNATGAPTENAGLSVNRGDSADVAILWNEATDRWVVQDGSGTNNILRSAVDTIVTMIDGAGTSVGMDSNDSIQFIEGSGVDITFTDTGEPTIGMTIANTDRGSSQAIFKNVTTTDTNSGYTWTSTGTATAESNNDTLTLVQGGGMTVSVDAGNDAIYIGHSDTSSVVNLNSNNSGNTFIQDISLTFDEYGHVTGATAQTAAVNQTQINFRDGDTTVQTKGDGSTINFVESDGNGANIEINWTDANNLQFSVTNTKPFDGIVIQDHDGDQVTLNNGQHVRFHEGSGMDVNWSGTTAGTSSDPYDLTFTNTDRGSSQSIFKRFIVENSAGTDLGTITADNNNDILYVRAGGAITMGVDATNDRMTISHSDTSSVSNLAVNNSGRTVIQDLNVNFDTYGHVTGISTTSVATLRVYNTAGSVLF